MVRGKRKRRRPRKNLKREVEEATDSAQDREAWKTIQKTQHGYDLQYSNNS